MATKYLTIATHFKLYQYYYFYSTYEQYRNDAEIDVKYI